MKCERMWFISHVWIRILMCDITDWLKLMWLFALPVVYLQLFVPWPLIFIFSLGDSYISDFSRIKMAASGTMSFATLSDEEIINFCKEVVDAEIPITPAALRNPTKGMYMSWWTDQPSLLCIPHSFAVFFFTLTYLVAQVASIVIRLSHFPFAYREWRHSISAVFVVVPSAS